MKERAIVALTCIGMSEAPNILDCHRAAKVGVHPYIYRALAETLDSFSSAVPEALCLLCEAEEDDIDEYEDEGGVWR